mmetsp:Transcript_91870/g.163537  ORF Transcript_91870/g.163537 Transcript_91870/m.163537 type:complete len:106 (+) Transcript_91870:264-581(+)
MGALVGRLPTLLEIISTVMLGEECLRTDPAVCGRGPSERAGGASHFAAMSPVVDIGCSSCFVAEAGLCVCTVAEAGLWPRPVAAGLGQVFELRLPAGALCGLFPL